MMLVGIAFVIAVPLARYMMQPWLEDYQYKIEMTRDIFAIAGIVSVVIALVTVSYQSVRAALANVAERLRGGKVNSRQLIVVR